MMMDEADYRRIECFSLDEDGYLLGMEIMFSGDIEGNSTDILTGTDYGAMDSKSYRRISTWKIE